LSIIGQCPWAVALGIILVFQFATILVQNVFCYSWESAANTILFFHFIYTAPILLVAAIFTPLIGEAR
jgi:ABC-type phosphate/phosphonate transport system permease subunit